jgi:hypothetical protein
LLLPLSTEAAARMKTLSNAAKYVGTFEGLLYKGGTGADSIIKVSDPNAAKEIMYELMTHDGSTLDAGSTLTVTPVTGEDEQELARSALDFWNNSVGVAAVTTSGNSVPYDPAEFKAAGEAMVSSLLAADRTATILTCRYHGGNDNVFDALASMAADGTIRLLVNSTG